MADYNGWTNYETWNVSLWLDNDEYTYNRVRSMARSQVSESSTVSKADRYGLSIRDSAAVTLARQLKSYVEDLAAVTVPQMYDTPSFVTDLFNAALSEVNWVEIAEGLVDEDIAEGQA